MCTLLHRDAHIHTDMFTVVVRNSIQSLTHMYEYTHVRIHMSDALSFLRKLVDKVAIVEYFTVTVI